MALLDGGKDVSKTYMDLACKYNLGFCDNKRVPIIILEDSSDFDQLRPIVKLAHKGTSTKDSVINEKIKYSNYIWNENF
jgi:hypothetical protein